MKVLQFIALEKCLLGIEYFFLFCLYQLFMKKFYASEDSNFQVRFSPFKKVGFICLNGRSLKILKNTFYFMLKALFSRYLKFCLDFSGHVEKQLDQKAKVNFKLLTSQRNSSNRHIAQYLKN